MVKRDRKLLVPGCGICTMRARRLMMDLGELIQNGWARHESDAEGLADDLEAACGQVTDPDKAAQFLNLANHTLGAHLKDWGRARALAERVVEQLGAEPKLATPLSDLAVARFMSGDTAGALGAESRAAGCSSTPLAVMIRTRVTLASMLVEAERVPEGASVFEGTLVLARAQGDKLPSDRAVAITSNNLASALLERESRSEAETDLMLSAAQAALEFWKLAGTWENEERAEYLLALVHNAIGYAEKALDHATRGLALIADNGEEVVDEAFLNLALAHACKLMGNDAGYSAALARADELAGEWSDEGLKSWFASKRAQVVG